MFYRKSSISRGKVIMDGCIDGSSAVCVNNVVDQESI